MKHIKFAGLASKWNNAYAKAYAEKLFEMGMFSKSLELSGTFIVAYSHKSFTRLEAENCLAALTENNKGETSKTSE